MCVFAAILFDPSVQFARFFVITNKLSNKIEIIVYLPTEFFFIKKKQFRRQIIVFY